MLVHAVFLRNPHCDYFRSPNAKQRKLLSSSVHVLLAYFRALPLVELQNQAAQLDLCFLLFYREMNLSQSVSRPTGGEGKGKFVQSSP